MDTGIETAGEEISSLICLHDEALGTGQLNFLL